MRDFFSCLDREQVRRLAVSVCRRDNLHDKIASMLAFWGSDDSMSA